MSDRKPVGYWKNLDNILAETKRIMEKEGWETLPGKDFLNKKGYYSFTNGLTRYHGGVRKLREALGQKPLMESSVSFENFDDAKKEAERIMEREGWTELPGNKTLRTKDYGLFAFAIDIYHGGFPKFREALGQKQLRVKMKSWNNLEFVLAETKRIMEREGWTELPGGRILNRKGYSSLAKAIVQYQGGMVKFKKLIGQDQKNKLAGTWKDLEYTLAEAKKAMEENGWDNLPGSNVLSDKGYGGLRCAIQQYYGGMRNFRERLGKEQIRLKMGSWNNLEFVLAEARRIMEKEGWDELPVDAVLQEKGYSSLSGAISKNHGGLLKFRDLMEERITERSETQQLSSLLETYVQGGENE